ncbi:MAG: MerR family transcriptional regulator [Cohaesibacteraceae bacterium]
MRWFYDSSSLASLEAANLSTEGAVAGQVGDALNQQSDAAPLAEASISQMADEFGVTMRTLRFYEEKGLLEPRRIGNRRFYNDACRARLRLILKGKAMGLGLDDVAELVRLVESDLSDQERANSVRELCQSQRDMLMARRDVLDEQLRETDDVLVNLKDVR